MATQMTLPKIGFTKTDIVADMRIKKDEDIASIVAVSDDSASHNVDTGRSKKSLVVNFNLV